MDMNINNTINAQPTEYFYSFCPIFILVSALCSLIFGYFNFYQVSKVQFEKESDDSQKNSLTSKQIDEMKKISNLIAEGAASFLKMEYFYLFFFIVIFGILILFTVEEKLGQFWSVIPFFLGAFTSVMSGYIGMKTAVYSNARTSYCCKKELIDGFRVAFKAGSVLGFVLVGLALINLFLLVIFYLYIYLGTNPILNDFLRLFECIACYGLGGSVIALFGRVGGGIYTKAADVGADLCGKIELGLNEDSPENPATIADNVGDNVGDIAGMGSDLFGSFAESTCAAMVIAATSQQLMSTGSAVYFPMMISAVGIVISITTSFYSTHLRSSINKDTEVTSVIQVQLMISTISMTIFLYPLTVYCLPETFTIGVMSEQILVKNYYCYFCIVTGLWSGMIIGYFTDYYTSYDHNPVKELAEHCESGATNNLISGFALGFMSTLIPAICLSITIYISYYYCGMYGIALGALGMLSTMCISLTIDGFGPISDNAGGIAEMCGLGEDVRKKTDALDAAGNTTAAIGKGFAIGSAALVSLALFGAFVTRTKQDIVNLLSPLDLCGLILGAMLPYTFSALTMKSVGIAANQMVIEVRRQKNLQKEKKMIELDPNACIAISTEASIKEMIVPGLMVIFTPLTVGFLFGPSGVSGVLAGALVSGVHMATSSSNSGGAWDNAKKLIEKDDRKGTAEHKAAIIGDTVGDPEKDCSGPGINILMKLMAILSLVFGGFFEKTQILRSAITRS